MNTLFSISFRHPSSPYLDRYGLAAWRWSILLWGQVPSWHGISLQFFSVAREIPGHRPFSSGKSFVCIAFNCATVVIPANTSVSPYFLPAPFICEIALLAHSSSLGLPHSIQMEFTSPVSFLTRLHSSPMCFANTSIVHMFRFV